MNLIKKYYSPSNSPLGEGGGAGKSVSVLSPATVANVVCGFDILGFALNNPNDEVTISLSDEVGVQIINQDDFDLPTDPEKNVSGAALLAML